MNVFRLYILALTLVVSSLTVAADCRTDMIRLAPDEYFLSISQDRIDELVLPESEGRQRSTNWCWAACTQMALNSFGLSASQEEIVLKVFDRLVDAPGSGYDMMRALNGLKFDFRGVPHYVEAYVIGLSQAGLWQELISGSPVVAGLAQPYPLPRSLPGHANLVVGVQFHIAPGSSIPVITDVFVLDPTPHGHNRIRMSWQEYSSRLNYAVGLRLL